MSERGKDPRQSLPQTGDDRPPRGAWAPGDYYCTCTACGTVFLGDKRAMQCAPCAYDDEVK